MTIPTLNFNFFNAGNVIFLDVYPTGMTMNKTVKAFLIVIIGIIFLIGIAWGIMMIM